MTLPVGICSIQFTVFNEAFSSSSVLLPLEERDVTHGSVYLTCVWCGIQPCVGSLNAIVTTLSERK